MFGVNPCLHSPDTDPDQDPLTWHVSHKAITLNTCRKASISFLGNELAAAFLLSKPEGRGSGLGNFDLLPTHHLALQHQGNLENLRWFKDMSCRRLLLEYRIIGW